MPTIKQKLVVDRIIENRGNISRSMREVGYSENSAVNPSNLTDSIGFQELWAKRNPDKLLADLHFDLLNKKDENGEVETTAVSKGLDMAYRLKGSYAPEKSVNVNIEKQMMADEELQSIAERLNDLHKRTSVESDGVIANSVDKKI